MFFHGASPPLVLTIQRMAFDNMQSENDKVAKLVVHMVQLQQLSLNPTSQGGKVSNFGH